jgi:hypothetical protein
VPRVGEEDRLEEEEEEEGNRNRSKICRCIDDIGVWTGELEYRAFGKE